METLWQDIRHSVRMLTKDLPLQFQGSLPTLEELKDRLASRWDEWTAATGQEFDETLKRTLRSLLIAPTGEFA
jgi:hypothetical protein